MSEYGNELSRRSVLKHSALATGSVVLGGVAASGTAAAGIGDGRVLDYHLNNINYDRDKGDIVANFVHDASPADNDGEWKGDAQDPVVKDGAVGNAFAFDGDGDYIEVGDDSSLDITSQVTVAAWGYLEGDPTTKQAIVSKDWDLENSLPYVIDMGTSHANNDLSFGFYTGNWHDVTAGRQAPQGEWFHVAGVFNNGSLKIYLNGAKQNENADAPESMPTNDQPLLIGRRTGSGTTRQDFNGKIDEVRVYDRALSDTEITELYEMKD